MADRPPVVLALLPAVLLAGCAGDVPSGTAIAAAAPQLPDRLSGRYAMDPARCGEVVTEDRLIVAPLRISFHESAGEVVALAPAGPDRWRVTLAMIGEGQRWAREALIRQPPGGETLALDKTLWHRCVD